MAQVDELFASWVGVHGLQPIRRNRRFPTDAALDPRRQLDVRVNDITGGVNRRALHDPSVFPEDFFNALVFAHRYLPLWLPNACSIADAPAVFASFLSKLS